MKLRNPEKVTILGTTVDKLAVQRRPVEEIDFVSGDKLAHWVTPPKNLFEGGDLPFKVVANGQPVRRKILPDVVDPCRAPYAISKAKRGRRPGASGQEPEIWISS